MDKTDREIIEILKEDGRASFTEIASQIGVSEGTIRRRVEEMEKDGTIERFTVETDGPGVTAVVMVEVSTGTDLENIIQSFPSDIEVNEVAGDKDLILELERESNEEVNNVLDRVREINGVEATKTYTVLKKRKL